MAVILGIVLAIMILMDGALFYVLRTAAAVTRRQVDACFLKESESYSGYLDDRREEGRRLEEKKKELEQRIGEMEGIVVSLKSSPFYAPRPIARELYIPTARYIDNDFFDNHKRVNDMLQSMDYQEIVDEVAAEYVYRGDRQEYDTAVRILSFLGMDVSYELCTLPPETQLAVLRAVFRKQEREKEMLERFLRTLEEETDFDVLDFRTYVREIRMEQDPTMYVRTGQKNMEGLHSREGLVCQYDGNISEGMKIICQNRTYDFSIYRVREKT